MDTKRTVGLMYWVTNILYFSLLKPCVAKAATDVSALKGIAILKIIITYLRKDDSDNIFTIDPEDIIYTIIIINEDIKVIFKADPITICIIALSIWGFNWLTKRITPVSNPILAITSEISMIALAKE